MNEYLERTDSFMADLGLETYRVGGSVRDELLGRRVKDADYVVRGASLIELRSALGRADDGALIKPLKLRDGRQAGWRVARKGFGCIEIMLPRTDRSTGPGHRDFEIVLDPTLTLEEDAVRRDFTFNALYKVVLPSDMEVTNDVLDPTGRGLYDLSHKMINTTYEGSFRDDPLRTLRALRFVSKLDYDLGSNTFDQMVEYAPCVDGLTVNKHISGTVLDELCKLLMGQCPAKALRLARDTGVLAAVLPELKPMLGFSQESRYHDMTTDEHTFKALETAAHVDAPLRVRMALLFHDSGKPESAWRGKDGRLHYYANLDEGKEDHEVVGKRIARRALKRLNAGNSLRHDVERLVENHMVNVVGKVKPTKVRRARVKLGDDLLRDLYLHRMCDLSGKGKPNMEHLQQIGWLEQVRATAQAEGVPASVKDLPINGHDLIELGYEGPAIGQMLAQLLDEVAAQPKLNDREWMLERAQRALPPARRARWARTRSRATPQPMRVLATADLHGSLPDIPDCDLLLVGGDIAPDHPIGKRQRYSLPDNGGDHQLAWLDTTFRPWLLDLFDRGIEVVGIAGNHDFVFEYYDREVKELGLQWAYLKDEEYVSANGGLRIWGTPWVPGLPRWAFHGSERALEARAAGIPRGIDILLSHGPPYGTADFVDPQYGSVHVGDRALHVELPRIKPLALVCGHIHEQYGVHDHKHTTVYNVSHNTTFYEPVNAPIELPIAALRSERELRSNE